MKVADGVAWNRGNIDLYRVFSSTKTETGPYHRLARMDIQQCSIIIEGVGKLRGCAFLLVEPNLPLASDCVAIAPQVIGVRYSDAGIGRLFGKSQRSFEDRCRKSAAQVLKIALEGGPGKAMGTGDSADSGCTAGASGSLGPGGSRGTLGAGITLGAGSP